MTVETMKCFLYYSGNVKSLASSQCCSRDLAGRKILCIFFLSGLQKLEQRAKKSIELRGECVE